MIDDLDNALEQFFNRELPKVPVCGCATEGTHGDAGCQ
jgi:hypothetical protein